MRVRVAFPVRLVSASALAAAACADARNPAEDGAGAAAASAIEHPAVFASDSSGIRVFTLARVPPSDDPDWEWGLRVVRSIPTVRGPRGDPILFDPQGATLLSDGRVVVVDGGEDRLAVIEPGSDSVGLRFGRVGQGPHELWGYPLVIWALADGGIAVADPPSHKVVRFTRAGEFVASDPTPPRVTGDRAAWQRAERTGELYAANATFYRRGGGFERVDSVVAFGTGDEAPRPVAAFPAQPSDGRVTWPAALNSWTVLRDGTVVMYRSDRPVFRVARTDGSYDEIRLPLTRAAMTEAEMLEVEGMLGRRVAPAMAPGGRSAESLKTIGNGLEPFGDSAFALQQYALSTPAEDPRSAGTVWRVIGLEGSYRGVIRFPAGFGALSTDGRSVIGFARDSLDVVTIQELRLEPPRALR